MISDYANGNRLNPRRDKVRAIADALNVNASWLIGYDVPMDRAQSAPTGPDTITPAQLMAFMDKLRADSHEREMKSLDTVKDQAAAIKSIGKRIVPMLEAVSDRVGSLPDKVEQLSLFGELAKKNSTLPDSDKNWVELVEVRG
jgi:transcriptional regulator with XRE-family HTH domain